MVTPSAVRRTPRFGAALALAFAWALALAPGCAVDAPQPPAPAAPAAVGTVEAGVGPYAPGTPANYCEADIECLLRDCKGTCRPFSRWNSKKFLCGSPVGSEACEAWAPVCGEDNRCRRAPSVGDLCADFEQPGCVDTGCADGFVCDTSGEPCVSSSCGCDSETGAVWCTEDCGGGTCVPEGGCAPVLCELFCPGGFATGKDGCEICECAPIDDCGCVTDDDCVKVTPGCCPCSSGGAEFAVAAACADDLEGCDLPPGSVACPAVYLCTEAEALCEAGVCVLGEGGAPF